MSVLEVTSAAHFAELTAGAEVAVVHFWADWAAACAQMKDVLNILSTKHTNVRFLSVEAEDVFEPAEEHGIEMVPTILLVKSGSEVGRIQGVDVPALTAKIEELGGAAVVDMMSGTPAENAASGGCGQAGCGPGVCANDTMETTPAAAAEDLDTRLKKLVSSHDVMLFMKGNPQEPRCGFSRKAVAILQDAGVAFGSFDILSDEEVRQGLKTFSNWPTFPQLYSKGALLGGLDIMEELRDGGDLAESLGN